jgi:hypothetical protein
MHTNGPKIPQWVPILATAMLAVSIMCASTRNAIAQGTWAGECKQAKPCTLLADVPVAAGTTPTVCVVSGLPGGDRETPVIDKTALPADLQAIVQEPRVCRWPTIILPAGAYSLTAIVKDAAGRSSDPSAPLSVTALPPLAPPSGFRLVTP